MRSIYDGMITFEWLTLRMIPMHVFVYLYSYDFGLTLSANFSNWYLIYIISHEGITNEGVVA